jgi:hypothetical protein
MRRQSANGDSFFDKAFIGIGMANRTGSSAFSYTSPRRVIGRALAKKYDEAFNKNDAAALRVHNHLRDSFILAGATRDNDPPDGSWPR